MERIGEGEYNYSNMDSFKLMKMGREGKEKVEERYLRWVLGIVGYQVMQ